MKVFISWSGERSKAVATQVKQWVGQVFQGSEVFMSDEDIMAGTNWSERIKKELADTTVGIICMTPENQDAKWINFEMGALSKEVTDGDTRVIPLLIGFDSTQQVGQPAASLNMVMLNKDGFKKIAYSLNQVMEHKREHSAVDQVTEMWWKELSDDIEAAASEVPDKAPPPRTERAMVEEILDTVRGISKQLPLTVVRKSRTPNMFDEKERQVYTGVVSEMIGDDFGYILYSFNIENGLTIKTEKEITGTLAFDITSRLRSVRPEMSVSFDVLDGSELGLAQQMKEESS
ncbi:hypothetical protein ABIB48_002648 [Arthrobacter sp. UYCu511]|uniref:toll/interleukin-1 receptor domain-containing protein n=1 Tax=Arthrobacter sp. UYCu511 TaxID=3156337 RepID=UPI00339B98A9